MAARDEFAARIARIEQRAKTGQKAEFAPLVDHPGDKPKRMRRGLFSGVFGKMVIPLAALAFLGGAFAGELAIYLPEDIVMASNPVSAAIRSQMSPEIVERMASGAIPVANPPLDPSQTDTGLANLLVSN